MFIDVRLDTNLHNIQSIIALTIAQNTTKNKQKIGK